MAPLSIGAQLRGFWHTLTSNDRHASHDAPYRTGQHVPLSSSRHPPLTSVATHASESRLDLDSPYMNDGADSGPLAGPGNGFINNPLSPSSPYSPGMRSSMHRQSSIDVNAQQNTAYDKMQSGEIQMQSFSEGLPPPPPVSHSWKRIDRWMEDNYGELFDNVCEGCTNNDVNDLEHQLDCTLPMEVRESLQIHDGQERGGLPTGIFFGLMLLDCEEMVQEWDNWRTVNQEFLSKQRVNSFSIETHKPPAKAFGGGSPIASSSSAPPSSPQLPPQGSLWRENLLAKQESQPPNAIQKAYAHPAWIPMARDWGGNNIAVDLAPGPTGKWGQVIIFGRDYDCKYVIARSWAAFLANFADDLTGSGSKVWVDEDNGDLRFKPFKNADPGYLDILRWRVDQKYGRRNAPRRRPGPPGSLRINADVSGGAGPNSAVLNGSAGPMRESPYGSPTLSAVRLSSETERGRSPSRISLGKQPLGSGALNSPRATLSSPLARVAEERPSGIQTKTEMPRPERLVSIDNYTPRQSVDHGKGKSELAPLVSKRSDEDRMSDRGSVRSVSDASASGTGLDLNGKADANGERSSTGSSEKRGKTNGVKATVEEEKDIGEMRTVEI